MDISAVSSLCCCPKNAENLICFDITLHSRISREGLSIKHVDLPHLPPKAFIQTSARGWDLEKLSLLCTSYSLDFGSCFTFNLLKFKPKYCFTKILHKEKFHFLVSFYFETQFEVCQNDSEQVFENCSNPPIAHSRSDTDIVQIIYRTLSSYSWLPQLEVSEIP